MAGIWGQKSGLLSLAEAWVLLKTKHTLFAKIGRQTMEYEAILEQAGNDPQKAKMLSSLLAYQDMAHGMKATFVKIVNQYTSQVLYRLGFKWSATTWDYVEQMLISIEGLGFFD